MSKIAIMTDSGCGISPQQAKAFGLYFLPLQISCGPTTYRDCYEISTLDIYQRLAKGEMPKTACPNGADIDDTLREIIHDGYDQCIFIPLSSGLSSTGENVLAFSKEHPLDLRVVECGSTCQVELHVARYAKALVDQGLDIDTIIEKCNAMVQTNQSLVVPFDLNHLKRGGRLTPMAASLANLLKIKPVLLLSMKTNGKLDVYAKIRTERKALSFIVDEIKKACGQDHYHLYILHSNALATAQQLEEMLQDGSTNFTIDTALISSVIAVHTGLNCVAIQMIKDADDMH